MNLLLMVDKASMRVGELKARRVYVSQSVRALQVVAVGTAIANLCVDGCRGNEHTEATSEATVRAL